MNKFFRGVIVGAIISSILTLSLSGIAATVLEEIQVALNSVNIAIDGKLVGQLGESYVLDNGDEVPYSILYKGTTYLPIRKVSELVDMGIGWNGDTRTVVLGEDSNIGQYLYIERADGIYINGDVTQVGSYEVYNEMLYVRLDKPVIEISVVHDILNDQCGFKETANPNLAGEYFSTANEYRSFEMLEVYEGLTTAYIGEYSFYSNLNSNEIKLIEKNNEISISDDSLLTNINGAYYINVAKWAEYMDHEYSFRYDRSNNAWILSVVK